MEITSDGHEGFDARGPENPAERIDSDPATTTGHFRPLDIPRELRHRIYFFMLARDYIDGDPRVPLVHLNMSPEDSYVWANLELVDRV
jgi:hypothetical protein